MTFKAILNSCGILVVAAFLSGLFALGIANLKVTGIEFDKSGLLSGLISFSTGAIVATFLTLFHSKNKRIEILRGYSLASATLYLTVILSTALVSVSPLFLKINSTFLGFGIDNFVTVFAMMMTLQVILCLFMLISLFTKEP